MAHKRVPAESVAAVRAAFLGMEKDPQGHKVLAAVAEVIKAIGPLGFVAADDRDYDSYRSFFKNTLIKGMPK